MKSYNLRAIPDDLWKSLKIKAATDGITLREAVVIALQKYTEGYEDGKADSGKAERTVLL